MSDAVNKYLEVQQKLHERRILLEQQKCSERSKTLAKKISHTQDLQFGSNIKVKTVLNRTNKNKRVNLKIASEIDKYSSSEPESESEKQSQNYPKHQTNIPKKSTESQESDEDYVPSETESEYNYESEKKQNIIKIRKQQSGKVVDDGDKVQYLKRIQQWKQIRRDTESAEMHELKLDTVLLGKFSADIEYLLDCKRDKVHKINGSLSIPAYFWNKLYKYQKTGIKWLWELNQSESGGILGDEMGLGKTIQVIAFFCTLSHSRLGTWHGLGPSIIIAPATVIHQWVSQFHYWWPSIRIAVLHQSGSFTGSPSQLIRDIHDSNGILVVTYAGIVKHKLVIASRKWHYVVLDEGHKIRNADTQVSQCVKNIKTPYKIIVTGSPLQNNLQELWSLFDFICPGLLGTMQVFMEYFANPITQGGYANATTIQQATGLAIATSLKSLINPYILRRTKASVQEYLQLPDKNEQVLFCSLVEDQRDLYRGYLLGPTVRSILDKEKRYGEPFRARILVALTTLRKICNHPDLYLYECNEGNEIELDNVNNFGSWKRSGKMVVIDSLLKIWKDQGHRALIFTQSRAMLCVLEQYLQEKSYEYLKMDGSTSVASRQVIIKKFNEDTSCLVFLATTRVGGLGVNLTGADRVIIYDPDWNPATDTQAKERAWRIGQKRSVIVYRLITAGSIEEKIYQRQVFKELLSNKVLVDPKQKNLLKTSTLQGLFSLEEPSDSKDTETVNIFKHTKVNLNKAENEEIHLRGDVVFTKEKLQKMKDMARKLSKNISKQNDIQPKNISLEKNSEIDPRQRYKQKMEELLHHPTLKEELQVNIVDENITNSSFDKVLCKVDIVQKHLKKNPLDFLDKLKSQPVGYKHESSCDGKSQSTDSELLSESLFPLKDDIEISVVQKCKDIKKKKKRKQCANVNIDDVKSKKRKVSVHESHDDFVLSKLFANAAVKNALEHDKVVGLVEREERDRLKREVEQRAKKALRAIKRSRKLR